jgi:hypothetical protein
VQGHAEVADAIATFDPATATIPRPPPRDGVSSEKGAAASIRREPRAAGGRSPRWGGGGGSKPSAGRILLQSANENSRIHVGSF